MGSQTQRALVSVLYQPKAFHAYKGLHLQSSRWTSCASLSPKLNLRRIIARAYPGASRSGCREMRDLRATIGPRASCRMPLACVLPPPQVTPTPSETNYRFSLGFPPMPSKSPHRSLTAAPRNYISGGLKNMYDLTGVGGGGG